LTYPKVLEHTNKYLVNIQILGDKFGEVDNPVEELNYLATSFEIIQAGGSDFIHQKGRKLASAFATQPSLSVNLRCYMKEPDFSILITQSMIEQQHMLLTIGKIKEEIETLDIITPIIIDSSAIIYEILGYIRDSRISAQAGEFVLVDFTVNVDDINELDPNKLLLFNP
jgi:hypothetical protein